MPPHLLPPWTSPRHLQSPISLLPLLVNWHTLLRRRHFRTDWRIRMRRRYGCAAMSTILHLLAVHAGSGSRIVDAGAHLVAPLHVYVFNVEGVDVAGEVAQYRKQDVDQ